VGDEGRQDQRESEAPSAPRQAAFARWEAIREAGAIGTVGLSFVLSLVIGIAIGWWLDNVTGASFFKIVFFLLGLAAGIRSVYVVTKRYLK
jgi:F0F1-type ATP synthase assembly protein I